MPLSDAEFWDEFAYTELDIQPLTVEQVQPASIDLRLGSDFKRPLASGTVLDTVKDATQEYEEWKGDSVVVEPEDFVLGTTMETVYLPPHIYGEVKGRSSVGRVGIEVHKTAGVIDPGYRGEITLEITNDNPDPVEIHSGQRICQIVLEKMGEPAEKPYGSQENSKYQNQEGATPSQLHKD